MQCHRGAQGAIIALIGVMEDEALGGFGEERCAARHLRAGRASKIADFWTGSGTGKSAGTDKKIVRFSEILRSSKKTLVNFLSVPPLVGGPCAYRTRSKIQ